MPRWQGKKTSHAIRGAAVAVTLVLAGCAGRAVRDYGSEPVASRPPVAEARTSPRETSNRSSDALLRQVGYAASPQPSVEAYVAWALANNPQISAAKAEYAAATWNVPAARGLPDPRISLRGQPLPVQTAAGEQRLSLGVSQQMPWHATRDTKAAIAGAVAREAAAKVRATELKVVEQVKLAYFDLALAEMSQTTYEQQRRLLQDVISLAEARVRGGGSQQDVLRPQVELAELDTQLLKVRQDATAARARLAAALGVSSDMELEAGPLKDIGALPTGLDGLFDRAVALRPELAAQSARTRREAHAARLARLAVLPEPTFDMMWIDTSEDGISPVRNGDDSLQVGVTVNVPIYRRRLEGQIRSADAQRAAAARTYQAVRDETLAELRDLFSQAETQLETVQLVEDEILPRAEQTLRVSFRSYEAGQIDLQSLLENWQLLLRYRLNLYRSQAQFHQTVARLERIVGGELPRMVD